MQNLLLYYLMDLWRGLWGRNVIDCMLTILRWCLLVELPYEIYFNKLAIHIETPPINVDCVGWAECCWCA